MRSALFVAFHRRRAQRIADIETRLSVRQPDGLLARFRAQPAYHPNRGEQPLRGKVEDRLLIGASKRRLINVPEIERVAPRTDPRLLDVAGEQPDHAIRALIDLTASTY